MNASELKKKVIWKKSKKVSYHKGEDRNHNAFLTAQETELYL